MFLGNSVSNQQNEVEYTFKDKHRNEIVLRHKNIQNDKEKNCLSSNKRMK